MIAETLKQFQSQQNLSPEELGQLLEHPEVRKELRKTYKGFCFVYSSHYLRLPPAEFHPEMIDLLGDWLEDMLALVAFRGSAKTTLGNTLLTLWAALEKESPFILPFNETGDVAVLNIANIRHELENNELLIQDYGDMSKGISKNRSWTKLNLLLANGVRIMGRSRGQKVRGLIHRGHRPSFVIIDDPEELHKVKGEAYRERTEQWLRSDVIPAIDEFGSRLILLLNLLHRDSLAARIKNDPLFTYREYPVLDEKDNIMWKGKYPDMEAIKKQEQKVTSLKKGSRGTWMREYMLKVISEEEQVIKEEWIRRYDKVPTEAIKSGVGVDLAISKKDTANKTAMVSGVLAFVDGMPKIYVLPNPVNARFTFNETMSEMRSIALGLRIYAPPMFFIEDVAFQKAAIQEAERKMIAVKGMKPGSDKRSRLGTASVYVQNGTVLFPKKGCEDLIDQLIGFGVEDDDDLADGFVYMVLGLAEEGLEQDGVVML
ncbi:MAG: hypothetical protein KJI72_00175 [Patescibacteria group bacterium]|nr:hypothetical protein [Patescibacteria group bacterium]